MDSSRRTSTSELSDPPAAAGSADPTTLQHWQQTKQGTDDDECWDDDVAAISKEGNDEPSRLHLGTITATLTNTMTTNHDSKPSPGHSNDQLIDSGYQKSITSTAEWSPQSPLQDGMFEEQFLNSSDGGKSCGTPPPLDSMTRVEDVPTLLQETDRSPSSLQKKSFWGVGASIVVTKEPVGVACTTSPGTSVSATNGKKMKKDAKDSSGTRKKSRSKVHDLVEEDVRDLTQCLILNSLNKLPLDEPAVPQVPELSPIISQELQGIHPPIPDEPLKEEEKEDVELIRAAEPAVLHVPAIEDDVLVNDIGPLEAAYVHQQDLLGIVLEPHEVDVLIVVPDVVENGDLANNNRDLEGNNYPDVEMEDAHDDIRRDMHEFEDNLNENVENNADAVVFPVIIPHRDNHQDQLELAYHHEDVANRNNVQNMPELPQQQIQQNQQLQPALMPALVEVVDIDVEEANVVEQHLRGIRLPPPVPASSMIGIEVESTPHSQSHLQQRDNLDAPELAEVHRASREALFDSDSQIDLLEDLPIPEVPNLYNNVDDEADDEGRTRNIVLVGVNNYDEGAEDPFPHWLLQLLGDDGDQHDEPHFYCQGDGVGVHPSIVEVDIEEDEPSTSSSSADTSSAETNAAANVVNIELSDQVIPIPSSSAGTLADAAELMTGESNRQIAFEVVGLAVGPRISIDQNLLSPNPPLNSITATPLATISPRTSIMDITTTATNLLDLNLSSSTDRDSADELFFDTTDDIPLTTVNDLVERISPREQNLPASAAVFVSGPFGCLDAASTAGSKADSNTGFKCE